MSHYLTSSPVSSLLLALSRLLLLVYRRSWPFDPCLSSDDSEHLLGDPWKLLDSLSLTSVLYPGQRTPQTSITITVPPLETSVALFLGPALFLRPALFLCPALFLPQNSDYPWFVEPAQLQPIPPQSFPRAPGSVNVSCPAPPPPGLPSLPRSNWSAALCGAPGLASLEPEPWWPLPPSASHQLTLLATCLNLLGPLDFGTLLPSLLN